MMMFPLLSSLEITALMPELSLCASAMILLMGIAFGGQRMMGLVHALAVLVLIYVTVHCAMGAKPNMALLGGALHVSVYTQWVKALLTISAALVLAASRPWLMSHPQAQPEYLVLALFSTLGLMLLVSAADFLSLYVALELSSLALYVIAAIQRDDAIASEAGIKYFVLGALSSCLMLFGISLIYGTTGTISFAGLQGLLAALPPVSAGIPAAQLAFVLGLVLLLIGLLFKISAVPFHMWTPDVYDGAPTPVTAFFANAPKLGALAALTTVLAIPLGPVLGYWQGIIVTVAVLSMLVGAWGAITQKHLKRLLAYSSIGHAGFMLVGLAAGGEEAISSVLLYMALYCASSIGAFAILLTVSRGGKLVETVPQLSGLARQHPLLAFAFAAFLFSMAGIPPLAGFWGKFFVFRAAMQAGLVGLSIVGLLTSVVSCFYYLKLIKVMYFDAAVDEFDAAVNPLSATVVGLCALVTLLYFVVPAPLRLIVREAAHALLAR